MNIENVVTRFQLLSAMNEVIRCLNNEEAYMDWINWVPDEATTEDLTYIAQSEEDMEDCERIFIKIINKYGEDGFYTGEEVSLTY